MKRMLVLLLIALQISLGGCSLAIDSVSADNIETLKGWSFQYNSGTNDYSLFFGLLDEHDEYISAEVNVDIRIVNDRGEEVYSETQSVSKRDFGTYESQASGKQFLANIRISTDDIRKGKSNNGTVYLTVYKDDTVRLGSSTTGILMTSSSLRALPDGYSYMGSYNGKDYAYYSEGNIIKVYDKLANVVNDSVLDLASQTSNAYLGNNGYGFVYDIAGNIYFIKANDDGSVVNEKTIATGLATTTILYTQTGAGIGDLMEAIVTLFPPPTGDPKAKTQALIFDCHYENHHHMQ